MGEFTGDHYKDFKRATGSLDYSSYGYSAESS